MRNFFKNSGIAAGYVALFLLVQTWASTLFMYGYGFAFALDQGAPADTLALFYSLMDKLAYAVYDLFDVIMLECYLALLVLLPLLAYAEQEGGVMQTLGLRRPRAAAMLWAPAMLGLGMYFAVEAGLLLIPEDSSIMQSYIESTSVLTDSRFPWLSLMVTVIGAPVIEETVFRGLAYKHLKRAMPIPVALFVQAAAFGLVHGHPLQMAYAFLLGLLLGYVCDYFDSIWASILVHLCFNGANYLPLAVEPGRFGLLAILLASLLTVAVLLLILQLYRHRFSATDPRRC